MLFTKKTFDVECDVKDANIVIIGIPWDSTETGKSVKYGPLFIRESIKNLIGYDPETGRNIFKLYNFCDVGDIEIVHGNWKLTERRIEDTIKEIFAINKNVLPVFFGGDHLITLGILNTFAKMLDDKITVVDFDAHRDLSNEWLGEKYSHLTWASRLEKKKFNLIQIGQRIWSEEEMIKTKSKIAKVNGPVYITIDMDVLDPSIAGDVGTPEPMGMGLKDILNSLKDICKNNIIGFDIVECAADRVNTTTALTAAFLFKKILAYMKR